MIERLLAHPRLRDKEKAVLKRLAAEPSESRDSLLASIDAFESRQRQALREFEFLDPAEATELAQRARKLLQQVQPDDAAWTLVVASIRYLVEEDDALSDTGRIDGLSDDRRVLDAVEDTLRHPDESV